MRAMQAASMIVLVALSGGRAAQEEERSGTPGMLQGMMVGEVGATSAILQTRLTARAPGPDGDVPGVAGVARFEVATDASFADPVRTPWQTAAPDHDHVVKAVVRGLAPDTSYHYRVEYGVEVGTTIHGPVGTFSTHPGAEGIERTSFVVVTGMNYHKFHRKATGDDARLGYPALVAIGALAPDFFVGTGDNVYYDHPKEGRAQTEEEMRRKWHEQFVQPRFAELFARVPTYWEKDDHDHRFNDCDREGDKLPASDLGIRIFREQVPVVDLDDPAAVTYRTVRVARDLQMWFLEGRDYRSPNAMEDGPDKTLWGVEQRKWLQRTLLASDATFKVVVSPTPLVGPDDGYKKDNHTNHGGFRHEGRSFLEWVVETGLRERGLFLVCGDRHWQYHSIDPTGIEELSTGALVDANARLGQKPGAPISTDPKATIRQPYTSRVPSGGFLHVVVEPAAVLLSDPVQIRFEFRDENGEVLHTVRCERRPE